MRLGSIATSRVKHRNPLDRAPFHFVSGVEINETLRICPGPPGNCPHKTVKLYDNFSDSFA
jgi:hypothetical protein